MGRLNRKDRTVENTVNMEVRREIPEENVEVYSSHSTVRTINSKPSKIQTVNAINMVKTIRANVQLLMRHVTYVKK